LPQLFTITDEWNEQPWFSTGGTRAKKYLQSPEGKFYYFKRSQYKDATDNKPGKDFTYEFWSEVIAYEVGATLGFNVLRYDIAIDGKIMGCISESMINSESQELIEVVKFLQAYTTFNPEDKKDRAKYTFQLIIDSLNIFSPNTFIEAVIETIIFDTIIGNGDRHQENWAIISEFSLEEDTTAEGITKVYYKAPEEFAPIYDNGSSLGRELIVEKVETLLQSDGDIYKYIDKGLSEIHWEGKKVSHFELIGKLLESTLYNEIVKTIINRVLEKWDGPKIEQIVKEIDRLVPESHSIYKIPDSRKLLIFKIITLRRNRLATLIHERI